MVIVSLKIIVMERFCFKVMVTIQLVVYIDSHGCCEEAPFLPNVGPYNLMIHEATAI